MNDEVPEQIHNRFSFQNCQGPFEELQIVECGALVFVGEGPETPRSPLRAPWGSQWPEHVFIHAQEFL